MWDVDWSRRQTELNPGFAEIANVSHMNFSPDGLYIAVTYREGSSASPDIRDSVTGEVYTALVEGGSGTIVNGAPMGVRY